MAQGLRIDVSSFAGERTSLPRFARALSDFRLYIGGMLGCS